MKKIDLESERKDVIGDLDRLLVSAGMALVSLFPTYFYLIFRPRVLCSMLLGAEVDGRERLKLGPGITFILTIGLLLFVSYFLKDVADQTIDSDVAQSARKGLRSSISEGNIWRSVILSLPFYFAALVAGVIFHLIHRLLEKASNLAQSLGIGLYVLSTALFIIAIIGIPLEEFGAENSQNLYVLLTMTLIIFVIVPWQFFSFSRHAFGHSKGVAAVIASISIGLILLTLLSVGVIGSQLST